MLSWIFWSFGLAAIILSIILTASDVPEPLCWAARIAGILVFMLGWIFRFRAWGASDRQD
ncbi:hypothetical protein ALI44B_00740 [Leifsonia sp. ALI-44-B]|nr:hypothetical protein ALI44B_00740 [Leifsonia sp. ALI-44-B]